MVAPEGMPPRSKVTKPCREWLASSSPALGAPNTVAGGENTPPEADGLRVTVLTNLNPPGGTTMIRPPVAVAVGVRVIVAVAVAVAVAVGVLVAVAVGVGVAGTRITTVSGWPLVPNASPSALVSRHCPVNVPDPLGDTRPIEMSMDAPGTTSPGNGSGAGSPIWNPPTKRSE